MYLYFFHREHYLSGRPVLVLFWHKAQRLHRILVYGLTTNLLP